MVIFMTKIYPLTCQKDPFYHFKHLFCFHFRFRYRLHRSATLLRSLKGLVYFPRINVQSFSYLPISNQSI